MSDALSIVIFGATGDLTSRKLIPALYRLARKGRLPDEARVVGVARSALDDDQFRRRLAEAARGHLGKEWDAGAWGAFARRLHYAPGDAAADGGLERLRSWLDQAEGSAGGRRLYYLAVAPQLYGPIATRLGEAGLAAGPGGWRRLVIEKPFGHDLASARELNRQLHAHFAEEQLYRIDHYLGKETVQNILVFRFANTLFEPVWNHKYIGGVQITVAEQVLVEGRGDYYDRAGVLRDMFQNHLLQVLTLVTMEAPARFAANPLRNEKVKVLDSIPVPTEGEARARLACGQYAGYRAEKGVAPDSRTPTYAALRLHIDNWRWQGVPFYLRSGKGLAARSSEVVIQFLCPPHLMFPLPEGCAVACNRLTLRLQPDEGIRLSFQTKVPDRGMALGAADLEFHYKHTYPDVDIPEAYERLLQDAVHGDASLFMRGDEIERAWELMEPFLRVAERPDAPPPQEYAVGSEGPGCAARLLEQDGRAWLPIGGG